MTLTEGVSTLDKSPRVTPLVPPSECRGWDEAHLLADDPRYLIFANSGKRNELLGEGRGGASQDPKPLL